MKVVYTEQYERWLRRLRDLDSKARIMRYFKRVADTSQLTGDVERIGDSVIEIKFHFSKGYRVYASRKGDELLLLLVGGDKKSQDRDIALAVKMAAEWRNDA